MKKLLLAGFAVLFALGCADNNTTEEAQNPYLPISDLVIPREVAVEAVEMLHGRGFAADCKLDFQLNGEADKTPAEVVGVDEKSMTFIVPASLRMGFYALILTQNNASTKIGGVNVKGDKFKDEDFEIYAVAGTTKQIYPVSITNQMRGAALKNSSTDIYGYPGYAVGLADGRLYYAAFDAVSGGKLAYDVGCYDSKNETSQTAQRVENFFAMGKVDEEFCILKTADRTTYSLVKWDNGAETPVRTFDFSSSGSQRIIVPDSRFVYYQPTQTILLSGNMGSGDQVGQATFSLDMQSGAVTQNGGSSSYNHWYAVAGEELYAFVIRYVSEVPTTQVFKISDPNSWNLTGTGATLITSIKGMGFQCPIYSPVSGKIYGMNDMEASDIILTFDPALGVFETRRWVAPGLNYLLYLPQVTTEK